MNEPESPPWFPEQVRDYGARKCLNGTGAIPSKVLFVDRMPAPKEVYSGRPYTSRAAQFLMKMLREIGFDNSKARFTYAMRHVPKKVCADEQKWGMNMLKGELEAVKPDIVVCFGAEPLKAIVGMSYRWDDVHGAFFKPDSVPNCPFEVFATFNLEQVLYNAKWDVFFRKDLERIRDRVEGTEKPLPKCQVSVVHTPEELDSFGNWLLSRPGPHWISIMKGPTLRF